MADEGTYISVDDNAFSAEHNPNWVSIESNYDTVDEWGALIMWCIENIKGKWTILPSKMFSFENHGDALVFKIAKGAK